MPNDLYSDAAPEAAAQQEPATEPEPPPEEDSDTSQTTAELPKAVLGGQDFKPGEEVVLRVVQVMENSVLVEYASSDEPEQESAAPEPAAAPKAGQPTSMYE